MRPLVALALLLTASAAQAGDQSQRLSRELHGIKGADDRVAVAAAQYPWSAMGRLNNGIGGHCSAVLVGPSLLATAAHCLWNHKTRAMIPASSLTFVAGYDRGAYLAAAKVTRLHPSPHWNFAANTGNRADDWALVELDQPLGEAVGVVAIGADPEPGRRLVAAGYGKDKAHIPTAHLGCAVTERRGPVLIDDCDAVQGDSGGPVLVWRNGQPQLAGLNVAVMLGAEEMGVAVAASAFKAEASRLGAVPEGRPGSLSQPLDPQVRARAEGKSGG